MDNLVPRLAKARYDEKDAMDAASLNFRTATPADSASIIAIINAAYAIETFLEGDRIDEERLAPMMLKGSILVAENSSGHLLGTVYTELRGSRGYMGMLAVDPAHQGSGLARRLVERRRRSLPLPRLQRHRYHCAQFAPRLTTHLSPFWIRRNRHPAFQSHARPQAGF